MATGTVIATRTDYPDKLQKPIARLVFAWTSSSGGAVSGTTTTVANGVVGRVSFVPGSGGSQPTDAYDVTLLDQDGLDVLAGRGANLSNAAASHVCPGVPITDGTSTGVVPVMLEGTLELQVANAGNAKSGTVTLYLR